MSKVILAAGIVRDIEFDSLDSLEKYLWDLECKVIAYKELDRYVRPSGEVIVRIVTRYNGSDLIEL